MPREPCHVAETVHFPSHITKMSPPRARNDIVRKRSCLRRHLRRSYWMMSLSLKGYHTPPLPQMAIGSYSPGDHTLKLGRWCAAGLQRSITTRCLGGIEPVQTLQQRQRVRLVVAFQDKSIGWRLIFARRRTKLKIQLRHRTPRSCLLRSHR